MTVNEVKELIVSNKNHKKYTIEEKEDGFTVTQGNFRLTINKNIADNIETELPYTYLGANRVDRVAKITDIEKDINVLLSRDWEPQLYSRGFHLFIGEPEHSGMYYLKEEKFIDCDWYDLFESVETHRNFDITSGYAIADTVDIETISSLPKGTLNAINNLDPKICIDAESDTYSDKYTDWYGYGFSKGEL